MRYTTLALFIVLTLCGTACRPHKGGDGHDHDHESELVEDHDHEDEHDHEGEAGHDHQENNSVDDHQAEHSHEAEADHGHEAEEEHSHEPGGNHGGMHSHNGEAPHSHEGETEHVHANGLEGILKEKEEDVHTESKHTEGEIHFTQAQAKAAELRVELVHPTTFRGVIRVGGKIQSSQGNEQSVSAPSSGIMFLSKASLTEGANVGSHETLAHVSSAKLQDGDPFMKAKIEFETAEKEYNRAKRLVADKIISEKEYNEISARYRLAEAAYKGQAENISAQGVAVKAPFSGYIKKWLVQNGQYVNAGEPIAVVAQNKRLQLQADVSESDFKYLRHIQGANFKPAYDDAVYRLEDLNGRLLSYGKSANDGSPYIPVTFEFDNVGDIIPGSFTEVYLLTGSKKTTLAVPVSALVEEQGVYFVFLRMEPEVFKKQQVFLGQNDGERVEILKGLKAGDQIVTHGAYSVKLANAGAAISGHTH